jgi:hypothetical protein
VFRRFGPSLSDNFSVLNYCSPVYVNVKGLDDYYKLYYLIWRNFEGKDVRGMDAYQAHKVSPPDYARIAEAIEATAEFAEFSGQSATAGRLRQHAAEIRRHRSMLQKHEPEFLFWI